MAVAVMMFKELRRNGGETAATAKNRHLPPNIFSPFLAELEILKSFEAILFFFKKITLGNIFAINTYNISNILLFNQKIT